MFFISVSLNSFCSFAHSDKISSVTWDGNPILCGCASQPVKCFVPSTKTTSEQPGCTSQSPCRNVTYGVNYEHETSDPTKNFTLLVTLDKDNIHKLEVVELLNLQNLTALSVEEVVTQADASGVFSTELEYEKDYSVCVTPDADLQYRQRTCTYIDPPRYRSTGALLQATLGVMVALVGALYIF